MINYASAGVTQALPLYGVPVLALPLHVEQWMVARALERTGMGRTLETPCKPEAVLDLIRRMLETASYRRAALALGFRYRDHRPAALAQRIADRIEAAVDSHT